MGGNQYENNATSWSNLQDCKISSKAKNSKLDPSVTIEHHSMIYSELLSRYIGLCLVFGSWGLLKFSHFDSMKLTGIDVRIRLKHLHHQESWYWS